MISIIISTYGEEAWAKLAQDRAWPSADAQEPYEIVIGHHKNASIAEVRNALGRKAKGDWLLFLDADDELAPGFVLAMEREIKRQANDLALLTPKVSYVHRGRVQPARFPVKRGDLSVDNHLIVGTLLHRDLFSRAGGFSDYPHGFEDWSLWYKCWKLGAVVVEVPRAVYIAHVNPDSKHRQGWRDKRWQVETHQRVAAELAAWTP